MNCEIIAIGSELLTPFHQDTNSLFLTGRLDTLGVSLIAKTIVGDRKIHLVSAIKTALSRADIVILTGGLGPTADDLTREATAEALNLSLHRNADILAQLYARFARRRRVMPDNNAKQADVLTGAEVLENQHGSAPGQWLDTAYEKFRKLVVLLPGPPHEMEAMFDLECMARLREVLPSRSFATRMLRIGMAPESEIDARSAPIYQEYSDIETTILAQRGEIQLHFRCYAASQTAAQSRVDELAGRIEDQLDELVFSANGDSLEQVVIFFLEMRGETLATAESCTGGLVAELLTRVSGSSRSFLGGAVVYTNSAKSQLAQVPAALIDQYGAISKETAAAMAEGIRRQLGSSLGLGVTGIAGPSGGTDSTPVGLVFLALSDGKQTTVTEHQFTGDRERIRWFASMQALDMIRRKLM